MNTKHTPATPLPWKHTNEQYKAKLTGNGTRQITMHGNVNDPRVGNDFAYIAHACNAYPKLVEALRDNIKELRLNNVNAEGGQRSNSTIDYQIRENVALLRALGEDV